MIGTDENRAVLHVEVIFWGGKRKAPPSLVSGKYSPHFVVTGTTEYLGVCFLDGTERCAFDETAWVMFSPFTRTLWTTARWKTMRNF